MYCLDTVGTTKFVLYREVKCIVSFIRSVLQEKFYCICILSYNINEIFIIYFSVYSRIERQFKLSLHLSGKLLLNKYVAKSSKV